MSKIYLVEAEHFSVPGRPLKAFKTREAAVVEAIDLVNIMLRDRAIRDQAAWLSTVPETWEADLADLQEEFGAAHCYVEIHELKVHS